MKTGVKVQNEFFSVFANAKNPEAKKNAFFVANIAKKSIAKSVDRNLYKRRIKSVFINHRGEFKNLDVLIMPGKKLNTLKSFAEIEEKLNILFKQLTGRQV